MAELIEVKVPNIGDFSQVEVIEVLVSEGDHIHPEDSLITVESDKASMEIPSPIAGKIQSIKVKVGDRVSEGDLILIAELESEPAKETAPVAPPKIAPEKPTPPPPAHGEKVAKPLPVAPTPEDRPIKKPHASPAVRRFARELGVDLHQIKGTAPKGRITKQDVQNFIKQALSGGAAPASTGFNLPSPPVIDFNQFGPTETVTLGRIKKISGQHLHQSWITIPHVTQFDQADITELEAFRKEQKKALAEQNIRLTLMPFLLKACVAALKKYPQFNASLAPDGQLILKKYFHIGIAVDTPNGLLVPVLRNVDQKGIIELADELMQISQKARQGRLSPSDMQGGCLTISSLGGIGGTQFTPIINAPEVAILGISRASMQPVWNGHEFVPRLIMPFSLSYDHRVIDGAEGVRFTDYLSRLLSDIRQLIL